MKISDVARLRMRNQRLIGAPFAKPEDVVRSLGAVQAQDYPGARWGIGQRVRGCAAADVDRAYSDGRILRTHVMRPTWHFVMPEDIRWLQALTAPRVKAAGAYYDRLLEIDAAVLKRSYRAIAKALGDGRHRTRAELAQVLAQTGVTASGQRLGHIVMHVELESLICSGAMRGKQHTYALVDERAPQAKALTRDDALSELTGRYFVSHGPALAKDFAWWSGLTVKEAQRGIESVKADLRSEAIEGKTYWFSANAMRARGVSDATVHLLPNYDEYLIAYRDHDASFGGRAPSRSPAPYEMLARHIVVLHGCVIGGWRNVATQDGVTIKTKLLAPMSRTQQKALGEEAERYGRFTGRLVTLQ